MAGNANSGRRSPPPAKGLKLPPLGETEASHRKRIAALDAALLSGALPGATYERLLDGVKVSLRALHQQRDREEIAELEGLLREAKKLAAEGLKRESKDRQHSK